MGAPAAVPTRPLKAAERFALAAGGLGWIPKAPGTWGSLGTVLVALPFLGSPLLAWTCVGLLVLAGSLACLLWGGRAVRPDGRGDPGWVVADEVAGQALALAGAVPTVLAQGLTSAWWLVAAAFVLFRVFDITKPGPVRRLERLPGGLGVLADDLGAGLAAGALVALVGHFA